MFSNNIIPVANPRKGRSIIDLNLANFNLSSARDTAFFEKYLWGTYLSEEKVICQKLRLMLSDMMMNPALELEYTVNTDSSYPESFAVSSGERRDFMVATIAKWKEVALFKPDTTVTIDKVLPYLDEFMADNKGKKYNTVEYEAIHNQLHNFLMGLHSNALAYIKLWPNHMSIHLQTNHGDAEIFGIMIMLARPE
jgi:hypothetical protein